VNHESRVWDGSKWVEASEPVLATVELDGNDVASIARSLREGSEAVILRSYGPVAFLAAAIPDTATSDNSLPEGALPVAVVDPMDKTAVLELLAVAPGPRIFRRHDGTWKEDPKWISVLASVAPPTMVKLDPPLVAAVAQQVDDATQGVKFRPFKPADADMYRPLVSSYVQALEEEATERGLLLNLALLAVAGRAITPKEQAGAERLKRYWMFGEGAAKIRWFTPGSWRRCYRHLVKYVGPKVAPGLCTNMSERLGGHGVATHVGD
jgi:hypothetical protein